MKRYNLIAIFQITILVFSYQLKADTPIPQAVETFLVSNSINIRDVNVLETNKEKEFRLQALNSVKVQGIEIPKGSAFTYGPKGFKEITSESIQINGFDCASRILFRDGKMCSYRLAKDLILTYKNMNIPKSSTIYFEGSEITYLKAVKEWAVKNRNYKQGSYGINGAEISSIPREVIDSGLCNDTVTGSKKEKVEQALKKLNISLQNIKIIYANEPDTESEYQYEGLNSKVLVLKPVSVVGNSLLIGATLDMDNDRVVSISLKEKDVFKQDEFECVDDVSLSKSGKICSCNISKPIRISNYTIKPPAMLRLSEGKLLYFLNLDKKKCLLGIIKSNLMVKL